MKSNGHIDLKLIFLDSEYQITTEKVFKSQIYWYAQNLDFGSGFGQNLSQNEFFGHNSLKYFPLLLKFGPLVQN